MIISWQPPNNVNQIGNLSGYYIFYREKDGPVGKWNAEGVPMLNSTSFLLRDLKAFTSYRIRMTLAVKTGNGPASEEVVNKTIEGSMKIAQYFVYGFALFHGYYEHSIAYNLKQYDAMKQIALL